MNSALSRFFIHKTLPLSAVAILCLLPSCGGKDDLDGSYGYDYEDDTEDSETSPLVELTRDAEDGCLFVAVVDDRGTDLLQSATVSGTGSLVPSAVQLSKDGGATSTAGLIGSAIGEPGWTAKFTVDPLDGSPNGLVGTETDFDGTWSITLTVDDSKTCDDIKLPLTLELLAEE